MARENWGNTGMPPLYVDVVGKEELSHSNEYDLTRYWIKGSHIHWGRVIQGYTGTETEVVKETLYPSPMCPEGRIRILKDRIFKNGKT